MYAGLILKKYIAIKQIGKGRFSTVWLCIKYDTRNYVSIKIFDISSYSVGLNEYKTIKTIKNNYCVSYIDEFEYNGHVCIVQELCAGSLYSIMKNQFPHGFPLHVVNKIIIQILHALSYIHEKIHIVHADLKPENILLVGHSIDVDNIIKLIDNTKPKTKRIETKNALALRISKLMSKYECNNDSEQSESECAFDSKTDETDSGYDSIETNSDICSSHSSIISRTFLDSDDDTSHSDSIQSKKIVDNIYFDNIRVILSDFGNSMTIDELTKCGDIQTRHYRSPEIILRLPINYKIDIWAFGCTVYELLTGNVLFNPNSTQNITCDMQHLYDIQQMLGVFPNCFFTGRKNDMFFRHTKTMCKFTNIADIDFKQHLWRVIIFGHEHVSETEFEHIYNLLRHTFIYDTVLRPDAPKLLELFNVKV